MKLYVTPGSPYARLTRIVVIEKGLEAKLEVIAAQTRLADSPYYRINPSGRVPYLVRDDGIGLEESAVIACYLDQLDGKPVFSLPPGEAAWEAHRLRALATSFLDGLSVWGREISRPADERSLSIIRHETARAERMAEVWEAEVDRAYMRAKLNLAQITLGCALGLEARNSDFHWRYGHPQLCDWYERIAARRSFAATVPSSPV